KPPTTAFIEGRIRSMNHEEEGVQPTNAFLDRLNIHSIEGYDVRRQVLGITAQHLKPGSWFKVRDEVGDGAFRRLAHKVDLELLARVAKSDCEGRKPGAFDCSAMDWFLERARALGVEHRPPPPGAAPGVRLRRPRLAQAVQRPSRSPRPARARRTSPALRPAAASRSRDPASAPSRDRRWTGRAPALPVSARSR